MSWQQVSNFRKQFYKISPKGHPTDKQYNKIQSYMLTVYTQSQIKSLIKFIETKGKVVDMYGGDTWWDAVSSVIIDGGAKKYNQMVKIWKSNKKDDRHQAVDEWMHKESKSKKIRFIENYMYALQPLRFDWAWKDEKDETFTTFMRYHKNDKIKDPQIRKAYEKWLADKETKKSKPKKKTTKRKAPAKKKTTKRKAPAKKKTTKRKTPAKKKTTKRKTPVKKKTTKRKTTKRKR